MPILSPRAAIAVLFTACAACAAAPGPAPAPAPAHGIAAAPRVIVVPFHSELLGADKRIVVLLPRSYDGSPARRYPVLYYLHGLSGSETDWLSRGAIDVVADSLATAGGPEAIVVLPDGDDGWYTSWTQETPRAACADTLRNESASRFCVAHQRYDEYLAREVVDFVDASFRTRADRAHRAIAGLSMGGYGAITLALRYPERFAAAASHSGVLSMTLVGPHPFAAPPRYAGVVDSIRPTTGFFPRYLALFGDDITVWRAHDAARIAESLVRRGGPLPRLRFDCGTDDPFLDQNRAFDWELTRLGVAHEYREFPGGHSWRYWSAHVGESMTWLLGIVGR